MNITTSEQLPGCWVATHENYDGPGSPIGMGFTEQDAIDDLLDILCGPHEEAARERSHEARCSDE